MDRSIGTCTRNGTPTAFAMNEHATHSVQEEVDCTVRALCVAHESRTGGFALLPLEGARSVPKDNAFRRDFADHHEGDCRGHIKNGVIP